MIKDYISASQVSSFLACPLGYKKRYINWEKTAIHWVEYMVYWTAVHAVLEKNYKQKIESRKDLPIEELIEYWHEIFKELLNKENKKFSEDIIDWLTKAWEKSIKLYMREVAPEIQPIASEQKFKITSEKYWITILWYIDLITEDGYIIDFKTVWASKSRMYTQNYVDNLMQLTMYSIAYRKMYKKTEKWVRIEALKRLKSWPKIACFNSTRSNRQIEQLGQLMKQMRKLIDLWLFYPNLNSCWECDYSATCDKLCIDDVEVEKETDTISVDLDISLD